MNDFYCEKVLSGQLPIKKVIETDNILAFHHTKPLWPVHIVVITKHHTESLLSFLNENSVNLTEMMNVIQQVVEQITKEYGGCRLTTNFGKFQTTKHLHWHIYVSEEMML